MKITKIGIISGSHGLRGHFKLIPKTEDVEIFYDLEFLLLGKDDKIMFSYEVEEIRENKKNFIVKCKGIDDIDRAKKIAGLAVYVSHEMLREYMGEDECYLDDFIGAKVITTEDKSIGVLNDIYDNGGNEIFVIEGENGKEYLISNNEFHVPKIDVENKIIVVDEAGLVSEDL
ncbi:MAG: rimM [Deferribacteraceae bacterium]|jgi:16S rRNA processing protein RimM|nr:rimM [Deferribacteraceae bacterium]